VDDDRPLYLFVHYIHPHEPYAPPERFDVFTDPAYAGSITGRHRTFDRILRGALVADARDREHLENLYAGNVLAADAAVGELLDRLAARDRWRETVVVVTSDHGDEFFERGLTGHNRTVYDELLRVPMVVRLPEAHATDGDPSERLVTLQDVAPTVARIAGAPLPWPIGAVDLLDPPDDPATIHDRWMMSRTADDERPIYGLRTVGFSAVFYPWADGELYVLANDPGELNDLRARRPDVFAGLSILVQRELWRQPFVPAAGDAGPRTEEELEMLRALGYVD
jgi:arylsulfatase A-like enzyme